LGNTHVSTKKTQKNIDYLKKELLKKQ